MKIAEEIQQSEQLIQWLDSSIDGLEVPSNDRMRLAAGCLATALEHQKAIVLLTVKSLSSSAAALVRLLFEAYVRGVWLMYSASDNEVEKFKSDKIKKIGDLIADIETHDAFSGGTLFHIKDTSWKVMNSFTHSGFYQAVRQNTAYSITSNHTDEEKKDALDTANSFGILTAIAIADMAGDEKLARSVFERGKEFFENEP